MSTYCITFRIANRTINGRTYDQRREQLIENARKAKGGYWEETTSFILAESGLNTDVYAKQVSDGLSATDDLVVVFDPADMSASYFGALKHVDVLRSFFPKLKKVP